VIRTRPAVTARALQIYDSCNQASAIRFVNEVIKRLPFRVLVIQTDNGAEFQSRFHWHLESLDIRHVYIRPRTPHLNGKVERSHRVDAQEFYQLLDKDGIADDIHLFNDKLREWQDYYNYIDHSEFSMGKRPTSGSWQKPPPVCHLALENLHNLEMVGVTGFEPATPTSRT
jgi:hypothetical protein